MSVKIGGRFVEREDAAVEAEGLGQRKANNERGEDLINEEESVDSEDKKNVKKNTVDYELLFFALCSSPRSQKCLSFLLP